MRRMITAVLILSATPVLADNISPWSTQGCGLWSASKGNRTVGPGTSIDTGGLGNYGINLDLRNCAGQVGPPGPQGPTGPQGAIGPIGPAGAKGTMGATGAVGAAGAAGTTGATGAAGTAGVNGATGAPGPQGPQGTQGAQGQQGLQGVAGPQGQQGLPGNSLRLGEVMALSSALSQPAWLENYERFSLSGGVGFSEGGAVAIGVTGIMRLRGSASGYAGFAIDPAHGAWGGKVGGRIGW